jgi:hypothetical protein
MYAALIIFIHFMSDKYIGFRGVFPIDITRSVVTKQQTRLQEKTFRLPDLIVLQQHVICMLAEK